MAAEDPTRGIVNDKPATLKIEYDDLPQIAGRLGGTSTDITLNSGNVIAVLQVTSSPYREHAFLYTERVKSEAGDSAESTLQFRLITATNVPEHFIAHFKPYEKSPWQARRGQVDTPADAHVIISTGSGTNLATKVWQHLVKPLLASLDLVEATDYAVHSTTSETSITELTQNIILPKANQGIAQSILLLSGDGGIVDIVNALLAEKRLPAYRKPTITLLPLGTGNALANSSGITGDETLGLSTMIRGCPRQLPLFRAMFSPGARLLVNEARERRALRTTTHDVPVAHGAVVCSWGHHAALVADSDTAAYRKYGAERFKMAAKEALFPSDGSPPHAYKGRVSIRRPGVSEWEIFERHQHGYVLATLVSQLEAGFNISPASRPLDGTLRLVHFGDLSGQEAMEVMGKAFTGGKHVEDARVGYEVIEALKLEFEEEDVRWRRVCIDGKIISVEEGGWVEVMLSSEAVVDLMSKKH